MMWMSDGLKWNSDQSKQRRSNDQSLLVYQSTITIDFGNIQLPMMCRLYWYVIVDG